MSQDVTVLILNRPGTLATVGEALGNAGVNIEGLSVLPGGGIHILVEDADAARRALSTAGIEAGAIRPVLVLNVQDRPGEIGKTCRRLADAGVNVDLIYLATESRLVIGVDNLDKARAVL
jgi:hypothetical protein